MRKLFMFVLSFLIWLSFAGTATVPVLILGAFISLIIAFFFGKMTFRFLSLNYNPYILAKKLFYIFLVAVTFIYDAYDSAIRVSLHTFQKKPSFSPGIVQIQVKSKSITAITLLSSVITLTPGTLVLDFDVLHRIYYIHWIDVRSHEEAEIKRHVIGQQERWINNIFS